MKIEGMGKKRLWSLFSNSFFTLLILLVTSCTYKAQETSSNELNEIDKYLSDPKISLSAKREKLNEFYEKALDVENDSLRNAYFLKLSYKYLKYSPNQKFRDINGLAFELAVQRKDTSSIAASYWDLAGFYHNRRIEDSAYFYYTKAQRLYNDIGNEYSAARLLLQMGNVECNIGNYTRSEISTAKAIYLLKKLKKPKKIYNAYNNLGIVYNELGESQKAIDAHEQALAYIDDIGDHYLYASTWNNMGVIYFDIGNYEKASVLYNKALNLFLQLEEKDPKLHAMLIDNLAIAKLYNEENNQKLLSYFKRALEIRQKNDILDGITISKIHLAEYYIKNNNPKYANIFLRDARQLAKKTKNTRDLLRSLYLLSETTTDSSGAYLKRHIALTDSLAIDRRRVRNKFTKIRLQTEKYISETKELSQTILLTAAGSIILIISLIFIYIIKSQKEKNIRLKLIQQRNAGNLEIKDLTLAMRDKYEEGAEQEKFRISRELHDGILGRIFGVRLSLDSLNDNNSKEAKHRRGEYLNEIKNISEDIRLISHRLNKSSKVTTDFHSVLKELLERIQIQNKSLNFDLFVDANIDWDTIGDNIKINLYRIIQEIMTNIQKHAQAKNVKISLSKEKKHLTLNIEDDGVGFVVKKTKKGIGLKNIAIRTANINGYLEIFSQGSGINGTIIKIVIET